MEARSSYAGLLSVNCRERIEGINPHVYAGNDPVSYSDPYGLQTSHCEDQDGDSECDGNRDDKGDEDPAHHNPSGGDGKGGGNSGGGGGTTDGCQGCNTDLADMAHQWLNTCTGRKMLASASITFDVGFVVSGTGAVWYGVRAVGYLGRAAINSGRVWRVERAFAQVRAGRMLSLSQEYAEATITGAARGMVDGGLAAQAGGVLANEGFKWRDIAPIAGSIRAVEAAQQACQN